MKAIHHFHDTLVKLKVFVMPSNRLWKNNKVVHGEAAHTHIHVIQYKIQFPVHTLLPESFFSLSNKTKSSAPETGPLTAPH